MNVALKAFVFVALSLLILADMVADDDIYNADEALVLGCERLLEDPYASIEHKTRLGAMLECRWDIIDNVLTAKPDLTKNIIQCYLRPLNAKADQIYWKHQLPYIMAADDEETKADRLISALQFSAGTRYTQDIIERFAFKIIGDKPERKCRFSPVLEQALDHYDILSNLRTLAIGGKISGYKLVAYDYHPPYLDRTVPEVKYDLPLLGREETEDYKRKKAASN